MFAVNQQPVKASGRRDFSDISIGHPDPAAMQNLARHKPGL
jgi:hypothetical protein